MSSDSESDSEYEDSDEPLFYHSPLWDAAGTALTAAAESGDVSSVKLVAKSVAAAASVSAVCPLIDDKNYTELEAPGVSGVELVRAAAAATGPAWPLGVLEWAARKPERGDALREAVNLAKAQGVLPARWKLDELLAVAFKSSGAFALISAGADPFIRCGRVVSRAGKYASDAEAEAVLCSVAALHPTWLVNSNIGGRPAFHGASANSKLAPKSVIAFLHADDGKPGATPVRCLLSQHYKGVCAVTAAALHSTPAVLSALLGEGARPRCPQCEKELLSGLALKTTTHAAEKAALLHLAEFKQAALAAEKIVAPARIPGILKACVTDAQAVACVKSSGFAAKSTDELAMSLELALSKDWPEAAYELVAKGARCPASALAYAVASGDAKLARAIIGKGANVNKPVPGVLTGADQELGGLEGQSPLAIAAAGAWGHSAELAQALLEAGAVPKPEDLEIALVSGCDPVASLLIMAGVSATPRALHRVAESGSEDIVRVLLPHIAGDLVLIDKLLAIAFRHGRGATACALLKARDPKQGLCLGMWRKAAGSCDPAILQYMLAHCKVQDGIPRDPDDEDLSAMLLSAAATGHPGSVKLLLDKGANPNGEGLGKEESPLWAATHRTTWTSETVLLLLGAGAQTPYSKWKFLVSFLHLPLVLAVLQKGDPLDSDEKLMSATVKALAGCDRTSFYRNGSYFLVEGIVGALLDAPRESRCRDDPKVRVEWMKVAFDYLSNGFLSTALRIVQHSNPGKTRDQCVVELAEHAFQVCCSKQKTTPTYLKSYSAGLLLCDAVARTGVSGASDLAVSFAFYAVGDLVNGGDSACSPALLFDSLPVHGPDFAAFLADCCKESTLKWPLVNRLLELGAPPREDAVREVCKRDGPLAVLRRLVDSCADPSVVDASSGVTALHCARTAAAVHVLLSAGVSPVVQSGDRHLTPIETDSADVALTLWCRHSSARTTKPRVGKDIVRWALQCRTADASFAAKDLFLADCRYHAVHVAAASGTLAAVQRIVELDPYAFFAVDPLGNTPLHWSLINHNSEAPAIRAFLLESGKYTVDELATSCNSEGATPLRLALDQGDTQAIKYMMDKGLKFRQIAAVGFPAGKESQCDKITRFALASLRDLLKGAKFTDPDFPPAPQSLWKDPSKTPDKSVAKPSQWNRITELQGSKKLFGSEELDPADIDQGGLDTCYLLSALASVVSADRGSVVRSMFISSNADIESHGFVAVRMYNAQGRVIPVLIDDWIPCSDHKRGADTASFMQPVFAHTRDRKSWYVALIEKAYAKLWFSSYEAAQGGATHKAVAALVGGSLSSMDLCSPEMMLERSHGNLWSSLSSHFDDPTQFCFVSCSISRTDLGRDQLKGLRVGHSYAVLRLHTLSNRFHLVQLHNPYSEDEWSGDWCSSSPRWTPALKKQVGADVDSGGSVFMEFEGRSGFLDLFSRLELCTIQRTLGNCKTQRLWTGRVQGSEFGLAVHVKSACTVVINVDQNTDDATQVHPDELTIIAGVLPFDKFEAPRTADAHKETEESIRRNSRAVDRDEPESANYVTIRETSALDTVVRWLTVFRKVGPVADRDASLAVCMQQGHLKYSNSTLFFFILRRKSGTGPLSPATAAVTTDQLSDSSKLPVLPVRFSPGRLVDVDEHRVTCEVKSAPARGRHSQEREIAELRHREQMLLEELSELRGGSVYADAAEHFVPTRMTTSMDGQYQLDAIQQ
eukprot:m51a1_g2453 hypothetical protein (1709) ;mRNA; f:897732-903308